MPRKITPEQQKKKILREAEKHGVESNYLFTTTFNRYERQLKILEDLEKTIDDSDTLVTKEYVKGRENVYTNPAIAEYNKTATAANNTAATLIKIIKELRETEDGKQATDEFMQFVSGGPRK